MRKYLIPILAALLFPAAAAAAADRAVVVELFTSQGCSSCPPADAYLQELAARSDVVALALHVDYWDYIGWKDIFAKPAYTARQRAYARAAGRRMVYTPQMVINGQDHVVGNRPQDVEELIARHRSEGQQPVRLGVERTGERLTIRCEAPDKPGEPMLVQLIRYRPSDTVEIERGENAGRILDYTNIVTELTVLREWDGRQALTLETELAGDQPAVVLLQEAGHGPIVAVAEID